MKKYGIPTAAYETFDNYEDALAYVEKGKLPVVLKADGLALGKGVLICETLEEAKEGLRRIMLDKAFGAAGNKVVVEEYLTGKEFHPGRGGVRPHLYRRQDHRPHDRKLRPHKRVFDGDKGPNTGGMGTFTPCPFYDEAVAEEVMQKILLPTVRAMNAEGRPFKGVLYFGLMRTPDGMKVVEYNARFGDPETQVVLPMLKNRPDGDLPRGHRRAPRRRQDRVGGGRVCVRRPRERRLPAALRKGQAHRDRRVGRGRLFVPRRHQARGAASCRRAAAASSASAPRALRSPTRAKRRTATSKRCILKACSTAKTSASNTSARN